MENVKYLDNSSKLLRDIMRFLTFDDSRDFPYYNHNPKISKGAWIVLIFSIFISFLLYGIILLFSEFIASIVFCFGMLIPLLYYSNWNYSLIFRKPTKNEILLGILMFIGYMIYAIIVGYILDFYGLSGAGVIDESFNVTIETLASLIFSMMGEELVKFIPLMFFMRLIFKFTDNRKLSIGMSTIIVLIGFGLLHYGEGSTLASVLLLQGAGSIFEMYGYLKTKNLFVPYISHFLTDFVAFAMIFMGFG